MPAITEKIRLLYVDDCESLRRVLKLALESQGYEVTLAEHGADGLRTIEGDARGFSLIITDRIMPVMDGQVFLERLRERPYAGPILLITSALDASETAKYHRLGVSAILQKPFGLQEVYATVAFLLAAASGRVRSAGAEQTAQQHGGPTANGQRRSVVADAHARAVTGQ